MHKVWADRLQACEAHYLSRRHQVAIVSRVVSGVREIRDGVAARFRRSVNKQFWERESCKGFPCARAALELYLCSLRRLAGLRCLEKDSTQTLYLVYLFSNNTPATEQDRSLIRTVQPTTCSVSQFLYFCKTLYMFQTVFASVIRSSKLHIQRQVFVRTLLLAAASRRHSTCFRQFFRPSSWAQNCTYRVRYLLPAASLASSR